jgi:hypothetical protein
LTRLAATHRTKHRALPASAVWALAFCALAACKKSPEPPSGAAPLLGASAFEPHATAPAKAEQKLGISWTDPPGWQRTQQKSPVRRATYRVPHAASDSADAELGVFYFGPGEGGGVEANVQRWIKQFKDVPEDRVKRADRQVNGLVVHTVEITGGTFASGMPGSPSHPLSDYALLGAIVEAPDGSYFFKLTGPKATVAAARAGFDALLGSVKSVL